MFGITLAGPLLVFGGGVCFKEEGKGYQVNGHEGNLPARGPLQGSKTQVSRLYKGTAQP